MSQTNEIIKYSTYIDETGFIKGLESMKSSAESTMKAITQVLNSSSGSIANLGNSIVDINKKIISAMESSTGETDTFVNSLKGINEAIGVFDLASNSILPLVQAFQDAQLQVKLFQMSSLDASSSQEALNSTLTSGQSIVGLLTGEMGLAATATSIWNTACASLGGPIGVAAVAIGALAVGISAFLSTSDSEAEHMAAINAHIKEQTDAWDQLKNKQGEIIVGNLAEIDHTKALSDELKKLVSVNGEVKDGYADRVDFILGVLNSTLGTEFELIGNTVKGYKDLGQSIDDLIVKEKAQVILENEKESWTEATKKRAHALKELHELEQEYSAKKIENDAKIAEETELSNQATLLDNEDSRRMHIENINRLRESTEEKEKACEDQKVIVDDFNKEIAQYDADSMAVKSDNTDAMIEMINRYAGSYYENGEKIKLSIDEQFAMEQTNLESLQALRDAAMSIKDEKQRAALLQSYDGQIAASQASLDQLATANGEELGLYQGYIIEKLNKASELQAGLGDKTKNIKEEDIRAEQTRAAEGLSRYGTYVNQKVSKAQELRAQLNAGNQDVSEDMVIAAEKQAEDALTGYAKVASNVKGAMDGLPKETKTIFENTVKPMHDQLEGSKQGLWDKAKSIADGILGSLRKVFDINSPSKKTRSIFKSVMLGAEAGLEIEKSNLLNKTDTIAEEVLDRIANPVTELKNKFSNMNLSSIFDSIQAAILSEQLKMASVVQTQSKIEMLKTNILKAETQSIYGKVDALIENHVDLDGRELAVALAPMISEELAFNWR